MFQYENCDSVWKIIRKKCGACFWKKRRAAIVGWPCISALVAGGELRDAAFRIAVMEIRVVWSCWASAMLEAQWIQSGVGLSGENLVRHGKARSAGEGGEKSCALPVIWKKSPHMEPTLDGIVPEATKSVNMADDKWCFRIIFASLPWYAIEAKRSKLFSSDGFCRRESELNAQDDENDPIAREMSNQEMLNTLESQAKGMFLFEWCGSNSRSAASQNEGNLKNCLAGLHIEQPSPCAFCGKQDCRNSQITRQRLKQASTLHLCAVFNC